MSLLVIVFAEVMPKTVAINSPGPHVAPASRSRSHWAVSLFGPVTLATEQLVRMHAAARSASIIDAHQSVLSATEEIRGQVDLLHKEGGGRQAPSATCSAASSTCAISPSPT